MIPFKQPLNLDSARSNGCGDGPQSISPTFVSHGRLYEVDCQGVIHQLDAKPFTYDEKYIDTYNTEAYRRESDLLQALRLGFTIAAHGKPVETLLDYGYGNGAFLKFARPAVVQSYGLDVTGLPVDGVRIVNSLDHIWVDAITFWDALEHVPDLSFVANLPCETVVISLPFCHIHTMGRRWFDEQYKHRKPDEHLHHFDVRSLEAFMRGHHWLRVASSTHEDIVRKSPGNWPNILTMAFKR